MSEGYWHRYRTSRRRLLTVAGGFGLASVSMALLGCGGTQEEQSPPLANPASFPDNTTTQARPGGILKTALPFDAPSLDPLSSGSSLTHSLIAAYTYPRLLKFTAALYPDNANGNIEGDLAETFELSPDRLTLTLRLRAGLRWENRPPTNARVIDSADVLASWRRFVVQSPLRGDLI